MPKTPPSERQRLLRLQKQIYLQLKVEIDALLGKPSASIKKYERTFQNEFGLKKLNLKGLKRVSQKELLNQILKRQVTFVGDFHPFYQSQRQAYRLLREGLKHTKQWALGVEMFPSQAQPFLDQWLKDQISTDAFLEAVHYNDEWGFSWNHYLPLLQLAKDHSLPVLALNLPKILSSSSATFRRDHSDLVDRDRWAAGLITDFLEKMPQKKVLVLYGDLHLASAHLPYQFDQISKNYLKNKPKKSFKKNLGWLCIHQNQDDLYWKLAAEENEIESQALQLSKNHFFLLSSPPWAKLQSLLDWIRGEHVQYYKNQLDDNEESEGELLDHASSLVETAKSLCEYLEISPPSFDRIAPHTVKDADFIDLQSNQFNPNERKLLEKLVQNNIRFFHPPTYTAYLAQPSSNILAEIAARVIFTARSHHVDFKMRDREGFCKQVLETAFAFSCSLLLNPRRKCDLESDHQKKIRDLIRGTRFAIHPGELDARKTTLALFSGQKKKLDLKILERAALADFAQYLCAQFSGELLGKRSHIALLSQQLSLKEVRSLFLSRWDQSETFYSDKITQLLRRLTSVKAIRTRVDLL